MSLKFAINASVIFLSILGFAGSLGTFMLTQFYNDAMAEWKETRRFRGAAEMRFQILEQDVRAERTATAKEITEINKKLDLILETKLRRQPPQ